MPYRMNVPNGLRRVAEALCADFERREAEIQAGKISMRTAMEYEYLNRRILSGVTQIVPNEKWARLYIREIGAKSGYAKTALPVSERTYKTEKAAIVENILIALHLKDKKICECQTLTKNARKVW